VNLFKFDINRCVETLNNGGLILYPTDTIWGIGCDATNKNAVEKIYALKKRQEKKSMIILLADENNIAHYAKAPSQEIRKIINADGKPVTVIYPHAKNLAANLVGEDGTIAIRVVEEAFCKEMIESFGKPVVSTSANVSGEKPPDIFSAISDEIINGVDHVVLYRQDDKSPSSPSRIVKWGEDERLIIIRE
jgi:L-threonylcarbamoyladenylate synthase